ncbi:cupin domain-containing protein [Falsiroseomonas selenitidurans]|uniref:Cupin domain-containing protein n=1 Tax=Falsiroseomonas selenitidurans TaxID=2716335 RepID=A0ABX1EEB4_9PROT|nr:cupin domain-containing protein [Falsiroseomonas selenitidurans]NKC33877.1 cupin domain-containing protein [Falsiroseomonas selenitidurans]
MAGIQIRHGQPGSAAEPWVAIAPADLAGRAALLRVTLAAGEEIAPRRCVGGEVGLYLAAGGLAVATGAGEAELEAGDLAILGPETSFSVRAGAPGATLLMMPVPGTAGVLPTQAVEPGGAMALVPASGGTPTVLAGDLYIVKRRAAETGRRLGLLHFAIPPGGGPIPHVHHMEDEAFYVLDGTLSLYADGLRTHAGAGSLIFLPRGLPHGFHNLTQAPAAMLCLLSPGGGEQFFVEAGRPPGVEGATGKPDPAEIARILAVADRYGVAMRPDIADPYLPPPGATP